MVREGRLDNLGDRAPQQRLGLCLVLGVGGRARPAREPTDGHLARHDRSAITHGEEVDEVLAVSHEPIGKLWALTRELVGELLERQHVIESGRHFWSGKVHASEAGTQH